MKTGHSMRINKYLASCGLASRRKVEEYIIDGRIVVNGVVETNLSTDIKDTDVVLFDGRRIIATSKYEYYMINKPKGYISSVKDDRGRKVVTSLINTNARIFPVGRLDFNSEGLLLLTNDGELMYKLTHPKNNISKTYLVNINDNVSDNILDELRKGVVIDNYKLHPCLIYVLDRRDKETKLKITIFEGRNREIRKMFEKFGKQVVFLKRIAIQNLKLGNLKLGEYRKLTAEELSYLKNL